MKQRTHTGLESRATRTLAAIVAAAGFIVSPLLAADKVKLQDGTKVTIETVEELSSNKSRVGQDVVFRVRENVFGPQQEVLIRKGARATGKITTAKGAGGLGRRGKLEFTVESVEAVDGSRVPLRAQQAAHGRNNTGAMAAVTLLVSPIGVFIKGKNAKVAPGTSFEAYVDDTVVINSNAANEAEDVSENIADNGETVVVRAPSTASAPTEVKPPADARLHTLTLVGGRTEDGVITNLSDNRITIVTEIGSLRVGYDKIESISATDVGVVQPLVINLRSGKQVRGHLVSYQDGIFTVETPTGPATIRRENLVSFYMASVLRELE